MSKVITILLSVLTGATIVFIAPKIFTYKESSSLTLNKVYEIKKIKNLHLVKHTIQNILFLHKENNPEKSVHAVVKTKCIVSCYINLEDAEFVKENDSLMRIILPQPILADPFFDINGLEVGKVNEVNFTWLENNAAVSWLNDFKSLLVQEKEKSKKTAINNGILEDAKSQAIEYIQGMMNVTGNKNVFVEFKDLKN